MQNAISFWEMERGQDWLAHRGRTIAGEWDEMEKKKQGNGLLKRENLKMLSNLPWTIRTALLPEPHSVRTVQPLLSSQRL